MSPKFWNYRDFLRRSSLVWLNHGRGYDAPFSQKMEVYRTSKLIYWKMKFFSGWEQICCDASIFSLYYYTVGTMVKLNHSGVKKEAFILHWIFLCGLLYVFEINAGCWHSVLSGAMKRFYFLPFQVEIPRAFVCAESKIFDVSEWASCQVCIWLILVVCHKVSFPFSNKKSSWRHSYSSDKMHFACSFIHMHVSHLFGVLWAPHSWLEGH